jgi:hypothetical protein
MRVIRLFILIEGLSFLTAALIHFGVLMEGYRHRAASSAETVIGAVLLAGLVFSWILPATTRAVALVVQAFALLGTLVGIFTIIVGIGPRTIPDLTYHAMIVIVLVAGLIVTGRSKSATKSEVEAPSQ